MQGSTVVKLVVVAAIAFFAWRWWTGQHQHAATAKPESTSPAINCVFEARRANDYWSSRIGSFTNSTQGWDAFKSEMDSRLSAADSKCSCSDAACTKSTEAMNELRTMLSEVDAAERNGGGGMPTDLVQRQERVDQALDAARDAAK